MMIHLRAIAASLLIFILIPATATGAGAQVTVDIDPHVDFAPPAFFTAPDGELWVELIPAEPWEDGAPVDLFSIFFGFDVSNDTSASGGGWQFHAGEQSVFGTFDGPGGSGEFAPRVLLTDGGQRIRASLHITPAGPGDSPLFFQISAASLLADGGERTEATPIAGQVGANIPSLDPLLDATHEFDGFGFTEIIDPISSADQIDPSVDSGNDTITGDSDTGDTATAGSDGVDPADDVSSEEPETASADAGATASASDGTDQDSTSGSGGSNAVTFAAVIALVAAFFSWMLLRRRKNQEAELKKIDAITNEILQNIDAPPVDEPPDLPSR